MERIKKRGVKTTSSKSSFGDVTLNDFANADLVGKSRIKKVAYGKFDVSDELVVLTDDESNEKRIRHRKKNNSESSGGNCVYSKEIWFLISDYIEPEDVGKFSRICKNAHCVVNTAAFWFNLYKRYHRKEHEEMPFRLQPEGLKCLYGLKQRVIRALYYMYPPFIVKCLEEEFKMTNPVYNNVVVKRKCVLTWSDQKSLKEVIYCFKLKRMDTVPTKSKPQTFLELLDDISVNQEAGCLILEVIANRYIVTQPVLGLTLISVNYNMKSLELIFSSSVIPNSTCLTTIRFDTVKKLSVFHWWSPQYPHADSIPSSHQDISPSEFL